jgi:hypothetical protein
MMTHDGGIPPASAEDAWRATREETVHHGARPERFSAQKKAEVV